MQQQIEYSVSKVIYSGINCMKYNKIRLICEEEKYTFAKEGKSF